MMNLLLAQTEQEKRLTILYVSLFVFLMVLLIIDSVAKQKYIKSKPIKRVTWILLFIGLIALTVLYFVL